MNEQSRNFWKRLRTQANRTLGEQFWQDMTSLLPTQQPRLDMYRSDDRLVVVLELPGRDAEQSLKLSLRRRTLHIEGSIPYPYPVEESELLVSERFLGLFHREIELPPDVSAQQATASFDNGLLTITLHRIADADQTVDIPVHHTGLAADEPEDVEGGETVDEHSIPIDSH